WKITGLFALFLIGFDLVLVRWLKIGKTGWKRADYFWLAFAALGLLGAVSHARQRVASGQTPYAEMRATATFERLRDLTKSYSQTSIICRKFVRSQYSLPLEDFDRTQREFDATCQWFKSIFEALPAAPPKDEIARATLPSEPSVSQPDLVQFISSFDLALDEFNRALRGEKFLRENSHETDSDFTMALLTPILLAAALALRITKVTGELKLDKSPKSL
ncbi:MAG TPA: hypothetical protein VLN58_10795, partial [Verrucomicrobiae bacterium]|nr:hypothetical protein [Verrucomicrobiae bacterium]